MRMQQPVGGRPRQGMPDWAVVLLLVVFFPVGLILMWTASGWSPRTKRAVTGAVFFPVGAYFLVRHTGLDRTVKALVVVVTAVALLLMFGPSDSLRGWTFFLMMGAFLVLFLNAGRVGWRVPALEPLARPFAGGVSGDDGMRSVLSVEEARTAPERRLLLAREFARLADQATAASPHERTAWPRDHQLVGLRREAGLLLESAADPVIRGLPETRPDDPLTLNRLRAAAQALVNYLDLMMACTRMPLITDERLRMLMRDRTTVRNHLDAIVREIQT